MLIEFWKDKVLDIDLRELASRAVSVKGTFYDQPCRFLEIYGNCTGNELRLGSKVIAATSCDARIMSVFMPRVNDRPVVLGPGIYQPPFIWDDCSPSAIATSCVYNTNAIYRILKNLAEEGALPTTRVDCLLDEACMTLARIYRSNDCKIVRFMNNNINMYLISKVVETLVGTHIYNANRQEPVVTMRALAMALEMAAEHSALGVKEQMALALGKGIAFLERHACGGHSSEAELLGVCETAYKYREGSIAIDDRQKLIDMVGESDSRGQDILMCAILDDTAESVDDLLWMQSLIRCFPHFKIELLVNEDQVSVNFSADMLETVLHCREFKALRDALGKQLYVTAICCPLISFQSNLLPTKAQQTISRADFVYVKGLNFFETCQLAHKDTFYSFVVYGPISALYTGLSDFDGVFVFVPAGTKGYIHSSSPAEIVSLRRLHQSGETGAEVENFGAESPIQGVLLTSCLA